MSSAPGSGEYEIEVQIDEALAAEFDEPGLVSAIQTTLQDQGVPKGALTLVITDDAEVQQLNRTYRGLDEPTDVLSFAQQEDQPPSAAGDPEHAAQLILPPELLAQQALYLGDIIIAYPYTKKQAERNDRALRTELCLLAIHGTLHLLGFDHATPEEEAEMWAIQNRVLVMLGEEPIQP